MLEKCTTNLEKVINGKLNKDKNTKMTTVFSEVEDEEGIF